MRAIEANRRRSVREGMWLMLRLVVCAWALAGAAWTASAQPTQGPGGPILVVTSAQSTFGTYYAEILRTEGLNAFAVADIGTVTPSTLSAYDVVILAKMPLTAAQVTMFSDWVTAGGNLIAMAPDAQLAGLLGLSPLGTTLSNAYLLVDASAPPGSGIVAQTMQFHGVADLYTITNATRVATLYSNAVTATSSPAVTLRTVGSGKAAAFTYDLATSVVYTRQGNPAWATQERDGFTPIRSDDKYFGNAAGDPQPDWVDLTKVAIPQADEQQRLLANLVIQMNLARKPLPRFWYFPNGKKAVVVMTGDDHGNGGTAGRFDEFSSLSPAGCNVANWECVRGTSYVYPGTPLTNSQAIAYNSAGFEVGLHIQTDCLDFTPSSLTSTYDTQIAQWTQQFPGIPAPITMRHHCIVWSDWVTAGRTELAHGIRLDTSFYYWPPGWVNDTPGMYTGSAMPMRLVDLDGTIVDVYEATSQMTDESGQSYPFTIDTLLDRALDAEGYYGAYTVNAHTDSATSSVADAVLNSALTRNVPIVASRQMLSWLDARNASSFQSMSWSAGTLTFTIAPGAGANGLQAMLPNVVGNASLTSLTRGGSSVPFAVAMVKGIAYGTFAATAGTYVATYAPDTVPPTVTSTTPSNGATGVGIASAVSAVFSEPIDPTTLTTGTFQLRDAGSNLVTGTVSYDSTSNTARFTPSAGLAPQATYTATLRGGSSSPHITDVAGNALAADVSWSFTTASAPTCPCSAWSPSATPGTASANDPGAVEVGVKFRSDLNGYVSGIRFYKGTANTGTHVGNLWTTSGQRLATANFSNETATGWQQVNFPTPVAITANTVYVASYYAPKGGYAVDQSFFAAAGLDNTPIHLLRDGDTGGNGVYAYGSASTFPSSTYLSSNYWVDLVFVTSVTDTTPPTVTAISPANGATGVATTAAVSATFSEAIDPATVSASTFEVRDSANNLLAGSVTYSASTLTATFAPGSALLPATTYTATLHGGTTDPRIKDVAGNALASNVTWSFTTAAASVCSAPANAIVAENCLAGNPASEWDVSGAGDASIQGFATDISVNRGSTVHFKVSTPATSYRFDIYRLGWYGGAGARKIATVNPTAALPQSQPACLTDAASGLIDCGNWAESGSWTVPSTATSGIYIARAVRNDTGGASHIAFVVRDDASTSRLLFQTSDTTWQAYNNWGGNSLYTGGPGTNPARAYKVSYNRPFNTRSVDGGQDWLFNAEYPMVRWLEANGYDVSYLTGVDSERFGSLIQQHKVFMSVGHDEYWSGGQRANVEAARNAGVNLAFFSGNEIFWKTRWENAIDGSGTAYRTLVTYKETHANAVIDPADPPTWTGSWRDPRFSPPADGGRPENALSGTIFMVNDGATQSIVVPAADGKMRFWRNTSVATLAAGASATLPNGTLGYEWDADLDNGFRPAGAFRLSTTTSTNGQVLQDFGSTYGNGTVTHALTLYKHASGALVFGAGTVQWVWGLDATHDRSGTPSDVRMQQATVNLLADMGVQPVTLQTGLVAASASTDTTAPASVITSPTAGATVSAGSTVVVTGTATDAGGGVVGGVEVSLDGGTTWHPATGRASWSYNWTVPSSGSVTIRSRAVDDSGNIEAPAAGVTVSVGAKVCPCTIWPANATPAVPSDSDGAAVTLGVKFTSDQSGFISGLRFYKGSGNTGTHTALLYTAGGQLLASQVSSGETASGWQQVNFGSPVPVSAGTVYVAAYHTTSGHYADDTGYFATAGVDSPPLHALRDGASGGNGVYAYGGSPAFPASTYQSTNYWVDVVFSTTSGGGSDTTPPTVTAVSPANGATQVAATTTVTATFSEALDATTINGTTFTLQDSTGTLVPATVTYNATTLVATLTPSAPLSAAVTYTATVKGGATDPRVKDLAGNALAANRTWSFTVDSRAPTVSSVSPANGATQVSPTTTVTATFSEAMNAATITTSTFTLTDGVGNPVAATVTYSSTNNRATLTPSSPLRAAVTYTARVVGGAAGVKDVAGNALAADRVWTFTVDSTAPTITGISPSSGATGVARSTSVTATFSEAMDASTINGTTVTLQTPSGALVSATVSYSATNRRATLTPSATLAATTTYTATVKGGTTGVKDVAGNPLAADRVWSFTTR